MTIQEIVAFALGIDDCRICRDLEVAKKLQTLDPTERYVHVEFPDVFNKLQHTTVWSIVAWHNGPAERTLKARSFQQHEIEVSAVREAKLRELVASMMDQTGLEMQDVINLAYKLLSRRSPAAFHAFGVDISDIPDGVWEEYLMKRLTRK